ncbi:hypothetical protein HN011_005798 [Eciton burchellii]|nr:hypothetical protein HN011_005798 [Eciton burchellii]
MFVGDSEFCFRDGSNDRMDRETSGVAWLRGVSLPKILIPLLTGLGSILSASARNTASLTAKELAEARDAKINRSRGEAELSFTERGDPPPREEVRVHDRGEGEGLPIERSDERLFLHQSLARFPSSSAEVSLLRRA